ncbi:dicarboxylate/amino acid:cation symporter [Butyricimonas synergistica]|uniref:dicarboxylate/amino acid:cation symporter n=1 Tax=Butyricimonas synergistica TaxID=544644 RepID=UPI000360D6C3|nr:dicarboxylate/amino acid:cation symporter [Butyricimonas synergistica]
MRRLFSSTISKLILAVIVGILLGLIANEGFMNIIVIMKYILGQLIFFMVPLIILGFVSYSIAKMKDNASKMLGLALVIAYLSSIGAAFFAMVTGYTLIPHLSIEPVKETLQKLPELVFRLDIPPVVSVMTALMLAIMIGLATVWTKSEIFENLLDNFQKMVLLLINRILIPILPYFIAANFCTLSYEGAITKQLPIFLGVMAIVILSQFVWLSFLYALAGAISKKNPWQVLKYYGPAYLTAVGTMSSAATLAVALKCAKKSPVLKDDVIDFAVPLFSNIHLCGSILTEVFFVMTVSLMLYGTLPSLTVMILFILLLGIFAIGAPGVPGGTVIASLGIVISVLGFDEAGTALLLTIFALQDSFGTACNITGDGALTLIMTKASSRRPLKTEAVNS